MDQKEQLTQQISRLSQQLTEKQQQKSIDSTNNSNIRKQLEERKRYLEEEIDQLQDRKQSTQSQLEEVEWIADIVDQIKNKIAPNNSRKQGTSFRKSGEEGEERDILINDEEYILLGKKEHERQLKELQLLQSQYNELNSNNSNNEPLNILREDIERLKERLHQEERSHRRDMSNLQRVHLAREEKLIGKLKEREEEIKQTQLEQSLMVSHTIASYLSLYRYEHLRNHRINIFFPSTYSTQANLSQDQLKAATSVSSNSNNNSNNKEVIQVINDFTRYHNDPTI